MKLTSEGQQFLAALNAEVIYTHQLPAVGYNNARRLRVESAVELGDAYNIDILRTETYHLRPGFE